MERRTGATLIIVNISSDERVLSPPQEGDLKGSLLQPSSLHWKTAKLLLYTQNHHTMFLQLHTPPILIHVCCWIVSPNNIIDFIIVILDSCYPVNSNVLFFISFYCSQDWNGFRRCRKMCVCVKKQNTYLSFVRVREIGPPFSSPL